MVGLSCSLISGANLWVDVSVFENVHHHIIYHFKLSFALVLGTAGLVLAGQYGGGNRYGGGGHYQGPPQYPQGYQQGRPQYQVSAGFLDS